MSEGLGYKINPNVVTSTFDEGEGVLIDLESRRYFQLNETAMAIVQGVSAQTSMEALVASLVSRYEISERAVQVSIERTLRDLSALGFVSPSR